MIINTLKKSINWHFFKIYQHWAECWIFSMVYYKNLYENRMCNQWDNWRAYGPELVL